MAQPMLSIRDLNVEYYTRRGQVRAVNDASFTLAKRSTIAIVGESGCGKSTLGFSILRLVPPPGRIVKGRIEFDGMDLLSQPDDKMRAIRGAQIAMIFQDPMTSLNPVLKVQDHFVELFETHNPNLRREEAISRACKLLDTLGIGRERVRDYPHQFSGGMRQRVMIGLALALGPKLVIADEPTTALDVIVEAQILELLKKLKQEYGLTLILITHNIGIVAEMADLVAVMYAGKIVEIGPTGEIFENPLHPYTKGLLDSAPDITNLEQSMRPIHGTPPDLINPPTGCKFHPRCPRAFEKCLNREPSLIQRNERRVACHLYE